MSEQLGAAVLVDGRIVAWFAEWDETAKAWCSANYFGKWLVWRAKPPTTVPATPEELHQAQETAERLSRFFRGDAHE